MGEVLSQNEIDQLLTALNTGELDVDEYQNANQEKQVKEYDFARPSKFAKDHLRTLEIIFEHYARLVSTALPGHLRTSCQMDVINSEAVSYSEFANALSNPILLGIIDFYPLKGNVVMDMSVNIGYTIVDRLLGGKGEALDKERDFSEIELAIIERIMTVFVEQLKEPWENVIELDPTLDQIETNSQFAQVISPTEIVALVTLGLRIGNVEGLLNVCIPFMSIEPIIDKLNTKYWFSNMQEDNEEVYADYIEKQIQYSQIPVKAILGKAQIMVDDFVNLQVGDIIPLNRKVSDQVDVEVGNLHKFKGEAGLFEGKNAIKISEIIRKEEV